ncbi:bifunctional histidinol-phosphatase/imidazoleglycerol-phosphate dehydratase HisB [Buchnera aphidicola (Mindarus keteleerifoliae)]|uniref:bifunctional histidinol-phosphatase/imidazoleglycerol-phosphate dehydratase HisB n=1 Tax=Buchnera aphidicola TaxID=9 RepID=UPI0031B68439
MSKKILFIDRDGTLVSEPTDNFQIDKLNKVKLEKNVIPSLILLQKKKYKLVMVTNQDGLGSSSFSLKDFNLTHDFIINIFFSQGIFFEKVLICPHNEKDNCKCRKPKTKLVDSFILDQKVLFKRSYVIGDRKSDMEFAKNIGVKGLHYDQNKFGWDQIVEKILSKEKGRVFKIERKTKETKVKVEIWLDEKKDNNISTGVNFFDHMLEQVMVHAGISAEIKVIGDTKVDDHHTVEDTGIVLGIALKKALRDKKGINRFGSYVPMDESLSSCVIDISGRPYLNFKSSFSYQYIGDLSSQMIKHFFYSLSYSMNITLHLNAKGTNDHHIAESIFKSFGCSLKQAIQINKRESIPSSKGVL